MTFIIGRMWDAVPGNLRKDTFFVLQGGDDGLTKSSLGFYRVKIFKKIVIDFVWNAAYKIT